MCVCVCVCVYVCVCVCVFTSFSNFLSIFLVYMGKEFIRIDKHM